MFESLLLFGLGMQEILIIAFVVLLLFGGKKIPELMKGLGKGVKSFKEGMNEVTDVTKESGDRSQESGVRRQESGDRSQEKKDE